MKNKMRRLSVIAMFALASFSITSVVKPTDANAIIGIFFWPSLIVGAILEVAGIATVATLHDPHDCAASVILMVSGLVFLEEGSNNNGEFVQLTHSQATEFGLSPEEHQMYNKHRHQMKHIFESLWANVQDQGEVTTTMVRRAYLEMSETFDQETKVAFEALTKILIIRQGQVQASAHAG